MPSPRGFTLVEAVICIIIVGVTLVAALSTVGQVARARGIQVSHRRAETLAGNLLAEILQCHYYEPVDRPAAPDEDTPAPPPPFALDLGESGLSRLAWDDSDDYHGWSSSPPKTKSDLPLSQFSGWTRSATVTPVDPATLLPVSIASDAGVRLIEVTVTDPLGHSTTLSALRSEYESLERAPTLDTNYVSHVAIDLQTTDDPATRLVGGVNVLNHRPPAPIEDPAP